jgi:hypothetical protein
LDGEQSLGDRLRALCRWPGELLRSQAFRDHRSLVSSLASESFKTTEDDSTMLSTCEELVLLVDVDALGKRIAL